MTPLHSSSSNFTFLEHAFPVLYNLGRAAEMQLHIDQITCLFKLRQFGEHVANLLYERHILSLPHDSSFHNLLIGLKQEDLLPERVLSLLFTIKNKGNIAIHQNVGTLDDAQTVLFSSFKVAKWFYGTYADQAIDVSSIAFRMPDPVSEGNEYVELESEYNDLKERFEQFMQQRELTEEPSAQRTELRKRSEQFARNIELSEAETREMIDAQLRAAGWEVNSSVFNHKLHKTVPEKGRNMAIAEWPVGGKWADYALFVGNELYGVVEAKKYAKDISTDLLQSKTYAQHATTAQDVLLKGEWNGHRVPFLFSTNGRPYLEQIKTKSGIWFLDVRQERNQPRSLKGWISPEGLRQLYDQDLTAAEHKLQDSDISYLQYGSGLGLRDYQINAIQAIEHKLLQDPEERRMLVAMATGTGKTRTILGLCYRLVKANRFKRILFLVDRTILAEQTINTFSDSRIEDYNTFAEIYKLDRLEQLTPDMESRVHFATVQGMVKRLFYASDEGDILPVDTYDCIIVDEAHRGYLQDKEMDEEELNFKDQQDYVSKYRMVLDYFDAHAIALTATPALHTTEIFGSPVYSYTYREAVIDGYLIDHEPPYLIKTHLSENGITWAKGEKPKIYNKEINSIEELAELEDELSIDVSGFNKLVLTEQFNRTVIRELVKVLDPEGEEKTLIFAATDEHADDIVNLLREEFAAAGIDVHMDAIQKITGKVYDPKKQVRLFKNEKFPNIVVTVDLLTTGVDVPAICNLVFMRRVKSRILYEQMLGRATRKCDEIGKDTFRIYDAVRLYEALEEFTSMKPVVVNPTATFTQLAQEMDHISSNDRARRQLEQLIAKFHRKKHLIQEGYEASFRYYTGGSDPEDFLQLLKGVPEDRAKETAIRYIEVWRMLDELRPEIAIRYVSDHSDLYLATERGYGRSQQPGDYLEGFQRFIEENRDRLRALQIICTRPNELDRQSLKELKMELDRAGYTPQFLNAAWKDHKNQDIAADIISYIRTLALGSELVGHGLRIKRAVDTVRKMKNWNRTQLNWLDRFEKQLFHEDVLQVEDLDADPFKRDGGFKRLDKVFDNELTTVIERINQELYKETA